MTSVSGPAADPAVDPAAGSAARLAAGLAVVSLGSNLGDRLAHLRLGLSRLRPVAVSPVFETAPWGGVEQDDFLNVIALCEGSAAEVWRAAQEAEAAAERSRAERWGPRTLDVDVVWAEGTDPGLELPHPRAHERAFVLVPWLDVDPAAVLVGHGPVAALVLTVDAGSVWVASEQFAATESWSSEVVR